MGIGGRLGAAEGAQQGGLVGRQCRGPARHLTIGPGDIDGLHRRHALAQAIGRSREPVLSRLVFQDGPHSQGQQTDADQTFDALIVMHKQGLDDERAFDGAEPFLDTILAFE